MAGAADALQERRDRARRADLADEVDRADVDAELERSGRDERLEVARLQPLLDAQAALARQRAVVARDHVLAEPQREVVRDALGQRARVHEDQRRAVAGDQLGEPVVDVGELLLRRHRFEVARRHLDVQLEVALVAEVDHLARPVRADEEARDVLDRPLRRGEADAGRRGAGRDVLEALERQREVAAAAVAGERVDLVDDHGANVAQRLAAAFRGEQQVERLRRGDQDVGRAADHRLPLGLRRVAGAHAGPDRRRDEPELRGHLGDAGERLLEVALDVVAQGLQRRDVEDGRLVGQLAALRRAEERVDADEERGQGLAGPGRRCQQRVAAREDVRPPGDLRVGRRAEAAAEPLANRRVQGVEHRGVVGHVSPAHPNIRTVSRFRARGRPRVRRGSRSTVKRRQTCRRQDADAVRG